MADEPRIDHPGNQPKQTTHPIPAKADEPRIDTLRWRTNPGSTTMATSPGEPPAPSPATADDPRTDTPR